MDWHKRLNKLFAEAPRLPFDDTAKIVLISDCHRGDGSHADSFAPNQNHYFSALSHYEREGFTYIELGDGDELWENKRLAEIAEIHSHVYWLLGKLYRQKRLYLIYGNHDMVKKQVGKTHCLEKQYDPRSHCHVPLLPNIQVEEAIVLQHRPSNKEIFLLHGHQVDFLNYDLWGLARFLVRYVWRPLELIGVNNPTSAARNHRHRDGIERRLSNWVEQEGHMLVAGHTHRPVLPSIQDTAYFNDGSCVHPRCITCIEIEAGLITLVKWATQTKADGSLYVGREVLAGPQPLAEYMRQTPRKPQSTGRKSNQKQAKLRVLPCITSHPTK